MTSWEQLEKLLHASDYRGVVDVVLDLDAARRKALLAPLKEFERRARDTSQGLWHHQGALSVIGAAVLPGASTLAPWLVRNGFWSRAVGLVTSTVEVLKARAVPWLPDLIQRLADRMPTRQVDDLLFQLVFELVKLTGIDPPPTDGLVLAWAAHGRFAPSGIVNAQWLGLVPRMFEVAGVGREIDASASYDDGWPAMIAAFVADGRVDRATVIAAAIAALQRGGRLGDVRGYLKVYRALDPSVPEIVDRARDYVPLLADAHSEVAGVAQQHCSARTTPVTWTSNC